MLVSADPEACSSAAVLETPRLRLRQRRIADFDDYAAMWADPVVTRHIGGRPFTREEAWTRFLRHAGHWHLYGFGFWIVEERDCGHFIGEAGLGEFRRDVQPSVEGSPEAGWAFATAAHGRGYATEAMTAILAWGDAHLTGRRFVCLIDIDNPASLRVASKCGFREDFRTTYHGTPVAILARERPPRPGRGAGPPS